MAALNLDGVVRRDSFELAVRLRVEVGETVGVLGDVGSGKSTLLAVLAGTQRLAHGRLEGPDAMWDEPAAQRWVPAQGRPVAYLPSRPQLADDVVAIDQVVAASGVAHDGNGAVSAARRDAEALLDGLGVPAAVFGRAGWTLSGGESQRVALARCYASNAPIVLLDDPLAALDSRNLLLVRRWLAERFETERRTTVVACSDPADTRHLVDRFIELP